MLTSQVDNDIGEFIHLMQNVFNCFSDYFFLLFTIAVSSLLGTRQRTIVKRQCYGMTIRHIFHFSNNRNKESTISFGIVMFNISIIHLEPDCYAVRSPPIVIVKIFICFYIVLVAVGPVEIYFFPVIRDNIALVAGVAALGYKISVLIITAKEGV